MTTHRFQSPARSALCAVALLVGVSSVMAQALKPGLWEVQTKMQGGEPAMAAEMAQMQKEMANMPPEERKMIEAMMAAQGIKMQAGSDGLNISMKLCLTKEMVERDHIPQQDKSGCKYSYSPRLGSTSKFSFACKDSSGEGVMTFASAQEYRSKLTIHHSDGPSKKPQTQEILSSGRWQGGDCGKVKPIEMPKQP